MPADGVERVEQGDLSSHKGSAFEAGHQGFEGSANQPDGWHEANHLQREGQLEDQWAPGPAEEPPIEELVDLHREHRADMLGEARLAEAERQLGWASHWWADP